MYNFNTIFWHRFSCPAHTIHLVQSMLASVRSSFPQPGVHSCVLFFVWGQMCLWKAAGNESKICTYISGESSLATFIATSLSKGEAPSPTQTCENNLGASKLSNIFLWNIQSCDSLTHRFSVLCSSIKTSSVSKEAAFSGWTCTALTSCNYKDKIYS